MCEVHKLSSERARIDGRTEGKTLDSIPNMGVLEIDARQQTHPDAYVGGVLESLEERGYNARPVVNGNGVYHFYVAKAGRMQNA